MGRLWRTTSSGKRVRTAEGYRHEYEKWGGTERYKKDRASRNTARRHAIARGAAHVGDSTDVHHPNGVRDNSHTRVISRSTNRGMHEKSRLKRSARNKKRWGR